MDGTGLAGVVVAALHVASASQVPQFDTVSVATIDRSDHFTHSLFHGIRC